MISMSAILSLILALIVLGILWTIASKLAVRYGLDPFWVNIISLVVTLFVIVWAFGLFGITQPIVR